jgi:hypothetical protein
MRGVSGEADLRGLADVLRNLIAAATGTDRCARHLAFLDAIKLRLFAAAHPEKLAPTAAEAPS